MSGGFPGRFPANCRENRETRRDGNRDRVAHMAESLQSEIPGAVKANIDMDEWRRLLPQFDPD